MSELSATLSKVEIEQIAGQDDFKIAPFREDGKTFGTLTWIWSVEVDGKLYVRAYNGRNSRWYKSAMTQKAGRITGAGLEKKVRFEATTDEVLNAKIDDAYRKKYSSSPYLGSMISEIAKSATVNIFTTD
ncbi:MAG: hypothetical protein CL843_12160 [Crocinitomicaceae bacterium]|nr:hypothetical protein [Crocinitomicaceae bacterium]|tara:strand:- start:68 stop:457 length:390 start_codon:yes stop_codon:yes gene_type:complete